MRRATSAVLSTLAVAGLALPAVAGPAFNNKYESSAHVDECRDSEDVVQATITYNGPDLMWPPNHKQQPISVVARDVDADDADDDTFGLVVTISDDETVDGEEMNGSGNTAENSSFAGGDVAEDQTSGSGYVRAERSGQGDGRTYTISYTMNATNGNQDATEDPENAEGYGDISCSGEFTVFVPHDMRGGGGRDFGGSGNGQGNGNGGSGNGNGGGGSLLASFVD